MVVKSLGPSAKAYPPGKTLPETAKINLQGGDVVTVLGPASAQTLRGPGNFDAKQVALASAAGQRGRFGALRAAEVAHNPEHLGHRRQPGRQDLRQRRIEAAAVAAGQRSRRDGPNPLSRRRDAGTELGGGQVR